MTYETKFNLELDFVAPNHLNYFGKLDFGSRLKKKKNQNCLARKTMGHNLLSYSGSFERITNLFASLEKLKEWQICFPEKKFQL